MKKIISVILAVIMLAGTVALVSCAKKVEPKEAMKVIFDAAKETLKLSSMKCRIKGSVKMDGKIDGEKNKIDMKVDGEVTLEKLKSDNPKGQAEVKLTTKGSGQVMENMEDRAGFTSGEAKVYLKDGVVYLDVDAGKYDGKYKIDVSRYMGDILRGLSMVKNVDSDAIDDIPDDYDDIISDIVKKSTISKFGSKKTVVFTFDLQDLAENTGGGDVDVDGNMTLTVVVKKGYLGSIRLQAKNVKIEADDETVKGSVDLTLDFVGPGREFSADSPSDIGDYVDIASMYYDF